MQETQGGGDFITAFYLEWQMPKMISIYQCLPRSDVAITRANNGTPVREATEKRVGLPAAIRLRTISLIPSRTMQIKPNQK